MALLKFNHHGLTVLFLIFLCQKAPRNKCLRLALIQPWSEWNIRKISKLSYFDQNDLTAKFDLTEQKLV